MFEFLFIELDGDFELDDLIFEILNQLPVSCQILLNSVEKAIQECFLLIAIIVTFDHSFNDLSQFLNITIFNQILHKFPRGNDIDIRFKEIIVDSSFVVVIKVVSGENFGIFGLFQIDYQELFDFNLEGDVVDSDSDLVSCWSDVIRPEDIVLVLVVISVSNIAPTRWQP